MASTTVRYWVINVPAPIEPVLSPDHCRLFDVTSNRPASEILSGDRFRDSAAAGIDDQIMRSTGISNRLLSCSRLAPRSASLMEHCQLPTLDDFTAA